MTLCFARLAPLLLLLAAAPPPAAPRPAPTPAEKVAMDNVRGHVEFLADDLLEGRDTGSRGYEIAARYVASQFRLLGLEPGGTAGSWFVQVPLRRATTVAPTARITLARDGQATVLRWGQDAALRPSLTERKRTIDAPLVFVGFGLDEPLLKFDDYRGLDTRGAFVVVLAGAPTGLPTEIDAHLGTVKAETAFRHGAVGLIEIGGSGRRDTNITRDASRTTMHWVDREGRNGGAPLRAIVSLSREWQAKLFDGTLRTLAAVRAEARTGRPRGFALPGRLSLTAETSWSDFTSPEVVGRLPGTDPLRAGEHVVLMGHLDHLGIDKDTKPGADAIYNGALDNAAGVATMLEAAREFVASGRPPARSVLFVANTGEEKGLLGADYLAAHSPVPAGSITSVVDLDMPLPLYDFTDVTAFGGDHSTIARTIAEAGAAMGVRVSPDPMPKESIFTRSDHYQFVKRGVPAILLMTGYANGGEAVWKHFLAKTYHSPADDLSQPISWRALARYGELNYRIARALADAPDRPRWYANDYFGDRFAPGQPRAPAMAR
ncbi:MAG: M20/M25/M40 family metallo-hydrolase [Sphingomicrobium sp.]